MMAKRPIDLTSIQSSASKVSFTVDVDGTPARCEVKRSLLLGDAPTRDDFLTRTEGLLMKRLAMIQRLVDVTFADGTYRNTVTMLGELP
jgi:hypothetical protein